VINLLVLILSLIDLSFILPYFSYYSVYY
jgi:hypothetical protein